jgi:hypothetical protein
MEGQKPPGNLAWSHALLPAELTSTTSTLRPLGWSYDLSGQEDSLSGEVAGASSDDGHYVAYVVMSVAVCGCLVLTIILIW